MKLWKKYRNQNITDPLSLQNTILLFSKITTNHYCKLYTFDYSLIFHFQKRRSMVFWHWSFFFSHRYQTKNKLKILIVLSQHLYGATHSPHIKSRLTEVRTELHPLSVLNKCLEFPS